MKAFDTGRADIKTMDTFKKFYMASVFRISPEEVGRMGAQEVDSFIFLHQHQKKREEIERSRDLRRRY